MGLSQLLRRLKNDHQRLTGSRKFIALALLSLFIGVTYQNCADVNFAKDDSNFDKLGVCNGISCNLDPLTDHPAVTTILLALGDEENNQLVVSGASSQLIAETVVRYTSPKSNPRILLVLDHETHNEDPEDSIYVSDVLLGRYNVTRFTEATSGLTDQDLEGFDVVWFNNPGYPMSSRATRDALLRFKGGVILQGDDLSQGSDGTPFPLDDLTGLHYVDNGVSVTCDGIAYPHDNNKNNQFRVSLDARKIPGANDSTIQFRYGNDIDNTTIVRPDLEVLATALGGPTSCTQERPAIVRYLKNN